MSAGRKLVRFTTRAGLAGGVVYGSYQLGLWKSAEETIKNYESHKKQVNEAYHKIPPSITNFIDDKAHLAKQKTVDPVTESVSTFQKNWLDFDYSWMESEDGIVKPAWNKGVAVVCDFIAHLPENTVELTVKGWKYASGYINDSSSASGNVAHSQGKESTSKTEAAAKH